MNKSKDVNEYIAKAPKEARTMLRKLRSTIKSAAPKAEEKISYGIPYYQYYGRLAYFAAFKNHVSLYAWGPVMKKYASEVRKYQTSTGTLQFPIGTKIPIALVKKLVRARIKKNKAEHSLSTNKS